MGDHRRIADDGVELVSGAMMPLLGLGTWQARGRSAVDAVRVALDVGYRHIDTATVYGNERDVGQAVAASGVPRGDVFVTTKLPQSHAGRERATLEESLARARIRLRRSMADPLAAPSWRPARRRGSGCSGCRRRASRATSASATTAFGSSTSSSRRRAGCRRSTRSSGAPAVRPGACWRGIDAEASSSRATARSGPRTSATRGSSRSRSAHGVTPAQVVLRWHVEHRVVAIPKSVDPRPDRRERRDLRLRS